MNIRKILTVLTAGLIFALNAPMANAFVLDFEGLLDLEEIENFYNGGTGSAGSSGTNYGENSGMARWH